MTAAVDRLAAAALAETSGLPAATVRPDMIRAEMAAEDPPAALRADVLLAAHAAGIDLHTRPNDVRWRDADLATVALTLAPAGEFCARHQPAIQALLDREVAAGGHRDLPEDIASRRSGRPVAPGPRDAERAVIEHVVAEVITNCEDLGRETT